MSEEESWRDALPEPMREAAFIKGADSMEAAINEITNAASHMGNSIRIPSEEASQEDLNSFYARLVEKAPGVMVKPDAENAEAMSAFYRSIGQPETADAYKFTPAEGQEVPPDLANFAQIAHAQGLTQKQFEGVMGAVLEATGESAGIEAAQMREQMMALNTEWGMQFESRMMMVKNYLNMSGAPDGLVAMLDQGEMSPNEIKWYYDIATANKSPTELAEHETNPVPGYTPQEAQNQIQEILNNPAHPYFNPSDPRNKEAVRKMVELHKYANPGSETDIKSLLA